jgi:flagellar motor protein MotB
MRVVAGAIGLLLLAAPGCANNAYTLQGKVLSLQQEQATLAQRNQELQTRATSLDHDNQELEAMLAQSRQQTRVEADQVAALREQLSGATSQLAQIKTQFDDTNRKADMLAASVKRKVGATITANTSTQDRLPAIDIPGVEVRADGDVIRIELPGAQLFESGNARLQPQAGALIDQVAGQVIRAYPHQMIGIEGHTDSDPLKNSKWTSNQQLSIGRAMAVYDHLVGRTGVNPSQLFVVGHGANHPAISNGTSAGKERNRRVELVIYPDRMPGFENAR